MLEESYSISNIVFNSHSGLRIALEHYLTVPATSGFKSCDSMTDDPRFCLLKKLEQLVREMGSEATAVYNIRDQIRTNIEIHEEEHEEILSQIFERYLPKEPTESMQLYAKLGRFTLSAEIHGLTRNL
jgi:hypothetical protein